jgi:hypothetical protein
MPNYTDTSQMPLTSAEFWQIIADDTLAPCRLSSVNGLPVDSREYAEGNNVLHAWSADHGQTWQGVAFIDNVYYTESIVNGLPGNWFNENNFTQ